MWLWDIKTIYTLSQIKNVTVTVGADATVYAYVMGQLLDVYANTSRKFAMMHLLYFRRDSLGFYAETQTIFGSV